MRKPRLIDLSPAWFGMVMATGIVSLAAHLQGQGPIAQTLFWFNIGAYVLLWILNVLRALRHTRRFFQDMTDHVCGPGFFTTVALIAWLAAFTGAALSVARGLRRDAA